MNNKETFSSDVCFSICLVDNLYPLLSTYKMSFCTVTIKICK